ncbi:kinase-like domain-containing protein [Chaetomidium leptoderma]|uniref:Kinase-like domain-containing protein n=1 Tax=Chaetomidium leptoderma TaxID=669021 RepID=A0AAN6VK84_9PEZI|nr:kinase-like domain-containing protein [Chaetomidium leptoderma]
MECLRDNFHNGAMLGSRYQTISPLNHGSFGMVFMARDTTTNETVAIKCLTKRSAAPDTFLDFAIDDNSEELVLHSRLGSHPNIVNLVDSFETDAHVYLVLEFCPRGDLYEAIRSGHGPLETEHVRRFMLELVDAVAYSHAKGIYHRDIKPENIFLTQSGSMKLGDFGLATTEEWTYETTVGSDRYMSPEQYDSAGAGYSPAQADIWAIGICLLNILFSRNPFTTPTESDPLFLDFSCDKQSLFDVFPSMSQDTYEVIVQCMNMDPSKRSLDGVRKALLRVVSFTTLDEIFDDFCSSDRRVVANSNREPLRTPSIQSPQVDTGNAFPWAKALQATPPKPIRQLSVIPDVEVYEEDLFSKSDTTTDWMSGAAQTPSSYMGSNLGYSMQSFAAPTSFRPVLPAKATAKLAPMAGSLPITMSKNRNQSAMSLVFGRKDAVSKSWSDLWDEEEEEVEEQARQLQTRKEMNSRTWSHESTATPSLALDDDDTPRQGLSPETKTATVVNDENKIPSIDEAFGHVDDQDSDMDGLFLYEAPPTKEELPRHSTPSKRNGTDKWAALGERRRAHADSPSPKIINFSLRTGRQIGPTLPASSATPTKGHGVFDIFNDSLISSVSGNHSPQHHHHHQGRWSNSRDRAKECPKTKGRDRDWNFDWRKEKRTGLGAINDWVGNWQEVRS